jgi:PAS domain S-box-containing protein
MITENAADMIRRRHGGEQNFQQPFLRESSWIFARRAGEEARRTSIGFPLEYRILHKDGSWSVVESKASVIRNAKGEPEKSVIVNRDITDRKRAAEALERSESSFRSVVEDAPYGIYRASIDGNLILVNPALQKMLGYDSREELLQANLGAHIYRHSTEHQKLIQTVLQEQYFKNVELDWKRKDGAPIAVRCSGRPVKDEVGAAYQSARGLSRFHL